MARHEPWNIRSPDFSQEEALIECLAGALVERFPIVNRLRCSPRLEICTDFSLSESRKFVTVGILVTDFDDLMSWNQNDLVPWRSGDRRSGDSIGYKKITDGDIRDLVRMNGFLRCADRLPGLLVTLTLPTAEKYVFTRKGDCQSDELKSLRGRLKDAQFESLRRFATALAVVLKPVHHPHQELLWLCDHDEIIANDEIAMTTQRYLAGHIGATTGFNTLPLLVKPSDLDLGLARTAGEDVLAVPDLAAGGIGEYLEACRRHFGRNGIDEELGVPPGAKAKATEMAVWFGFRNKQLAKVALSVDPATNQAMVHRIENQPVIPPE